MTFYYKTGRVNSPSFKTLLSAFVLFMALLPFTLRAQNSYCAPQMSPVGANAATEPISLVQFGTGAGAINNASSAEVSTAVAQYEDFTSIVMNVQKGSTYTLVVKGNTDGNNTNYITVYIDWNQDGTFSNSLLQNEKYQYTPALINSTGTDDLQVVYDITIPTEALTGQTRMRVVKNYQAPSPSPCYPVATFGQTEDYTLNVMGEATITGVTVTTQNNAAAAITTANGTLQLAAAVTPATASQNVTWSITQGGTFATVNANGLVTATGNGVVTATATSVSAPTVSGSIQVTVSNQTTPSNPSAYGPVAITSGFNYDIIANGIGNASASSNVGFDETNSRALVSLDFQATASSAVPVYGLPANGTINSAQTSGVTFQLANYNGNNALFLTPAYVGNGGVNNGTLAFSAQGAGTLYILAGAAGGGMQTLPFSAIVNFSDGTTQAADLTINDWYSGSGYAIQGIGRVNRANNNLEGDSNNPRLYEIALPIAAANQAKTITGVTFTFNGSQSAEWASEIRMSVLAITTAAAVETPADQFSIATYNNAPAVITEAGGSIQVHGVLNGEGIYSGIIWSIAESSSGLANIDQYGQVNAVANGTVIVQGKMASNPDLFAEIEIQISGQSEGYCDAYFINGCNEYVYIASVTTTGGTSNINNPSSGCSNDNGLTGYANYTAQSVTAPQGSTVTFTLNFNTPGLGTAYLSAWIDWNQDFVFSENEQIYASQDTDAGAEPNVLSFTVNVPANASLGATRIRLKAVNGWLGSGPCGYNSYGEVEDYTFNVTAPVAVATVTVATQNNVPATITANGGTLQLTATVNPAAANQNVTWSVTTGEAFASVDANGLVTAIANGTVTVRATSAADATKYGELNVAVTLPANNCPSLTELYENFDTLSCCEMGVVPACWNSIRLGTASQIISSTNPASGTSQIYQFGYGAGVVSIVVLPQFSNVNAGTHQFRFKVRANSTGALDFGYVTDGNDASTFVTLESLTITNTSYNSADAERILTVPTTVPANARLAVRNPGTTFAGMYWDDVYWEPIPAPTITVATQNNAAAQITVDNGTLQLAATVTPQGNTVNWTITDGNANATVNANGLVSAVANGTVTVRATIAGTAIYDEITITITNQVIPVTAVTVTVQDDAAATITANGGTLQLEATVTPSDATTTDVVWTITQGNGAATVDENGVVTAIANGTVTVRATAEDGTVYGEITITISGQVVAVTAIAVTVENNAGPVITTPDGTLQLIATITPDNATTTDVVWTITEGSDHATVDENGLVTATANGTVTVRATSADGTVYDEITITISGQAVAVSAITVTVENDAEPVITTQGGTLQLIATVTPDNATTTDVVWTITEGSDYATVDENGVVTAIANGTVTVRATAADGTVYGEIEIAVNIILGLNDVHKVNYSLYPNPTNGIITITADSNVKDVMVYNTLGQQVYHGNQSQVNLQSVQNGVYFVQVQFENGTTIAQKIIRN